MITILFIVFTLGLPFIFRNKLPANTLANIAASIGILGTFVGVTISLFNFDVNDVARSVPQLLEGLKIAFITSISGMGVSLLIKVFPDFFGHDVDSSEETQRNFQMNEMMRELRLINQGISGEREGSLFTQLKQFRHSNAHRLELIDNSLREFGEKMVADSTQSLIDALTQVMQDFNTKINEQLGDNFKKFNEALGIMHQWQQEYAKQVQQMTDQFYRSLETIEECEAVLQSISKEASTYHQSAKKLDVLLENLNVNLVGLSEMSENVKEAFPIIDKKINELITRFASSVESAVRENNRMMQSQREAIDSQINTFQKSYEEIGQQQHKLISDLSGRMDKLMFENSDRIKTQMTALDEELGEQLKKSIDSLGKQLTSLSMQFVEDYTPLTTKLKDLVQLSSRIS
ncbi:DNA anti-recombination protein RmuC [Catalinimonas alkaloidigena]|uniref:MotA/TolQ/ExbB proton channel family protein n=1 Tax=Catalinimonas alkaloidigena TaxID=1075417 RepID=UPI002404C158|nr:MotA/TolQ/ExbB proton channel family protein [Catalinimonas alkaloidigena]MDF9795477.1 DNA anti-recombination protein RmuC [Catalinimonas alkaloidigena]